MTRGEAILYVHKHQSMHIYGGPASPHVKQAQEWCVTRDLTSKPRGVGPTLEAALEDLFVIEAEEELL
jgi:hypothetical protein